ncbi:unnamed protein product, partial [marine sediment metagenome]
TIILAVTVSQKGSRQPLQATKNDSHSGWGTTLKQPEQDNHYHKAPDKTHNRGSNYCQQSL